MKRLTTVCALVAAAAPSWVPAEVLYSTSFESPEFVEGPLGSQGGWAFSFGTDPAVTSTFSLTDDQSLVVSGVGATFGQNSLTRSFSTPAPKVSVKHSVYLDAAADWSNTFVTLGVGGDGFVGQLAIRNGSEVVLRPADEDLFSTAIERGEWIDLEVVFDFPSQTQEGFVNGVSIGSTAFATPAAELNSLDLFFTNFDGQDISFYVDDVSVTAIPEPTAVWLVAGGLAGLVGPRRGR